MLANLQVILLDIPRNLTSVIWFVIIGVATSRKKSSNCRIHYFNEDMEEICMLAMETLACPMAGIRTEDFELVRYYDGKPAPGLPRSLPT